MLTRNNMILIYLSIIIIVLIFIHIIYFYNSKFEKDIVVKEKYIENATSRRSSTANYYVVATDNTIYNIGNIWWKNDFNQADDYAKLDAGKTYHVKGYGFRMPIFGLFHKIYDIGM
jgi:hypothetical protein